MRRRRTSGTAWSAAAASSCAGSAFLTTPSRSRSRRPWRTACSRSPCPKRSPRSPMSSPSRSPAREGTSRTCTMVQNAGSRVSVRDLLITRSK
uniref:Uncharacterized protein n=1 Tax=Oryza brachyantha TaxID=4533 RepID=J3LMC0_ORYBR